MKITKFGHSCVLLEATEAGQPRTALFDPGEWSDVPIDTLPLLNDVYISHGHPDHIDTQKLHAIVARFPNVRVTAPTEVVEMLRGEGFSGAADVAPSGSSFFVSPHEGHMPFMEPPEEIGIHFLNSYSHPGDSHSFRETMPILALPVQAPWGSTIDAVDLAIKLKPRYVLPVHDWHWRDEARTATYNRLEALLAEYNIVFLKPENGVALNIEL